MNNKIQLKNCLKYNRSQTAEIVIIILLEVQISLYNLLERNFIDLYNSLNFDRIEKKNSKFTLIKLKYNRIYEFPVNQISSIL